MGESVISEPLHRRHDMIESLVQSIRSELKKLQAKPAAAPTNDAKPTNGELVAA
jgi:hypothetical protein